MAKELRDAFDDDAGSGSSGGPSVISWDGIRIGGEITGVIVPPDPFKPEKGGITTQAWTNPPDESKEKPMPAYWPPDGHEPRRPVSRREYNAIAKTMRADGEEVDPDPSPVARGEIYFVTDLADYTFMSEAAEKRLKADDKADNGVRRVLVDGIDMRPKIYEALDTLGSRNPPVGGTITLKIVDREENVGKKGKTNRFAVTITEPTEAGKAKAAAYVKAAKASAESAKMETSGGDEDPPF